MDWLETSHRDSASYTVCLRFEDYQIFVRRPWETLSPEELASDVIQVLTETEPRWWGASWHSMVQDPSPPRIAGPGWHKHEING